MKPNWLHWANELHAIAQAGLTYSKDSYDIERFHRLNEISAEIISTHTSLDYHAVTSILETDTGYLTPKVDIRAAIVVNNQILLVQECVDGQWSLPGGWADVNLTISENIMKEVKEEAGLLVKPQKIIAIHDQHEHNFPKTLHTVYKIFVLCEYVSGEFMTNIETCQSQFFELDKLPPLSTARNTLHQLQMCVNAATASVIEASFD